MAEDTPDTAAVVRSRRMFSRSRCQRARQRLQRDLSRLQSNPGSVIGLTSDAPPLLLRRVIRTRLDLYTRIAADTRWPPDVREIAASIRQCYQAFFFAGTLKG